MKVHYKGVLCNLATYRVMGEDKPALYYIDSPDQETMLKAGFVDVQPCLWVKVLTDEEYNEITNIFLNENIALSGLDCLLMRFLIKTSL
mgnify:CR=1 FL=1